MLSVTSETLASASLQTAPAKPGGYDQPQRNDSFGALLDSGAPADAGGGRTFPAANQQPTSPRRVDDAAASADNAGPRSNASSDQGAKTASEDGNATAKPASGANGAVDANTGAVHRSKTKSGVSKPATVETTTVPASDTRAAIDPTAVPVPSAQQVGTSVTTPNPVAVAIPVPIAPQDVPAPAPTSGSGTTPLAIAAAAIAASTPAPAAPGLPSAQVKTDSIAVAAIAPTGDRTPAVAAAATDAAANTQALTTTAKVAVPPWASEAIAPPVKQPAEPADAAGTTEPALTATVAAAAPVAPMAAPPKTPVATQAKAAAPGTADENLDKSDPSTTAPSAQQQNAVPQPAAAPKQQTGNPVVETANPDDAGKAASAPPTHDRSPLNVTAHAPINSPDTGVQPTTAQQSPLASAAAAPTPADLLNVTAATTSAPVPLSGVAVEIAAFARSGKSRFEIRLDPADLGRIDVRIDVDRDGRVTSHLTVEKPETLSMLRQDAPQLQRALDDAGFKSGDSGLQFSLRDQSSSGQNNGNQAGRNAQRLVISDEDTIPAAIAGRTYGRVLGSGSGVDIRV